jgi:hypothetical protein
LNQKSTTSKEAKQREKQQYINESHHATVSSEKEEQEGEGEGADDTSSMNSSVFQIVNDLRKHPSEKEITRSNPSDLHLFASMDDTDEKGKRQDNRGRERNTLISRRGVLAKEEIVRKNRNLQETADEEEREEDDEDDELNLSKYQEDLQYISQSIHEIHEKYRLSSSRSQSESNLLKEKEPISPVYSSGKKKGSKKELKSPSSSPTFRKGKRKEETRQAISPSSSRSPSPLKDQRTRNAPQLEGKSLRERRRSNRSDTERETGDDDDEAVVGNTIRRVESKFYEEVPSSSSTATATTAGFSSGKQTKSSRNQNALSVSYPLPAASSSAMMRNDALPSSPSFFAPSYRQNVMEGGTVGEVSREIIMELEEKLKQEEIKNNLLLNQIQSMPSNLTVATVSLALLSGLFRSYGFSFPSGILRRRKREF